MSLKILRIIARLNIGGPARNAVLLTTGLGSFQATSDPSTSLGAGKQQETRKYETMLVCGEVGDGEGECVLVHTLRTLFYWVSKIEKLLRFGNIGYFAPNITLIAEKDI